MALMMKDYDLQLGQCLDLCHIYIYIYVKRWNIYQLARTIIYNFYLLTNLWDALKQHS